MGHDSPRRNMLPFNVDKVSHLYHVYPILSTTDTDL